MAIATQAAAVSTSHSRLGRNLAVLAGSQAVTWSLGLLWTIFIPRALGPRGLGELTIATAVTGVVGVIAGLGIGTLLVKEIARDHQHAAQLMGTALLVRTGAIVPALGAVGLYVLAVHPSREQTLVLLLAAAAMVFGLLVQPFQSAFQGIERMEYLAYGDILTKAVLSLVGIALVIIGFRAVGIMTMILGISVVVLLMNVWWSRGKFGIDWTVDRDRVRRLVVDSLPYWTTGLVLTVYLWIDSVMLSAMSSTVVVGWYAVQTKIFETLLSAAFRAGAYALRAAGKPALESVLVLTLPVAAGAALIAQPFLATIYGPSFAPSYWVLVILALTVPATYFDIMVNQVLIASNRQGVWTKVMVAGAIVNPLINLFLIRYFQDHLHNGAIGAALSLLTTEAGIAVVGILLLPNMLDASSVLRLARAALATGGMALVVWTLNEFGLFVEVAAGAASFAALALILRVLNREELTMLRGIAGRVVTRGSSRASTTRYRGWEDVSGQKFSR